MKNTIGHVLTLTLFGESHGEAIGCVLDGLPSGLKVDEAYIAKQMDLRRAAGSLSTARREADLPRFVSGVKDGFTEGTPLTILIDNTNVRRSDYDAMRYTARPGHADYTAELRYDGYQDASGGGHFSGRLTAPLVAAGAILRQALEEQGILIGSHIRSLHGIADAPFDPNALASQIAGLNAKPFAVLDSSAGESMMQAIEKAREEQDSLGGVLETAVCGFPGGIGEPTFGSVESRLAEAMFSIGAVKGIEFGAGFAFADMKGSEANDAFRVQDGRIVTETNHNGGINGGITNGMPIVFRTVIKPTPSISRPQNTVNFSTMENTELEIHGRHDPAIIHRGRVVVDCMTAFILADMLCEDSGRNRLRKSI